MAVAIVSGGTDGIGRAVAARLAADGFTVIAFGKRVSEAPRSGIEMAVADVSDAAQIDGLVDDVLTRHGRVDAVCNAAGIKAPGTVLETTEADWNRTFAVNVKGAFLLSKAVLPTMIDRGGGVIVNVGSPSGYGGTGHVAYSTSKGALHTLTMCLAIDHLEDGIRANTVVPGSTRTGMNRDRPEHLARAAAQWSVAGRPNEPEEVAEVVAFLISDRGTTISGVRLEVGTLPDQVVPALPEESGDAP